MNSQDLLNLMRAIKNKPKLSQRQMAKNLGFSLGKLNYCLKALKDKGLVKIDNFKKNPNKLIIFTFLLQKEFLKTQLTINFMKRKIENMTN